MIESKISRVRKNCTPIFFSEDDREQFEIECSRVLFKTQERWVKIEDLGDQILYTINNKYFLIGDCNLWELYEWVKDDKAISAPNLPDNNASI